MGTLDLSPTQAQITASPQLSMFYRRLGLLPASANPQHSNPVSPYIAQAAQDRTSDSFPITDFVPFPPMMCLWILENGLIYSGEAQKPENLLEGE